MPPRRMVHRYGLAAAGPRVQFGPIISDQQRLANHMSSLATSIARLHDQLRGARPVRARRVSRVLRGVSNVARNNIIREVQFAQRGQAYAARNRPVSRYIAATRIQGMFLRRRRNNDAARRIQNLYRQRNARRAQVARRRRFPFPSSSSSAHMDESVDDLVHDDDVKGSMIGGGTMPNVATFRDPHDHLSGGGGVVHNNFNPHDAGNFLDEDAEAGYKRSRHEAELATGQREHINNFPRIENAGEELDETTQHFEDI